MAVTSDDDRADRKIRARAAGRSASRVVQGRPRPMSAELPYKPHRRFSALTRRILFLNAFALFILMGGVLWVQSNRAGLVEERISGIRDQALIVAGALAEYAAVPERRTVD